MMLVKCCRGTLQCHNDNCTRYTKQRVKLTLCLSKLSLYMTVMQLVTLGHFTFLIHLCCERNRCVYSQTLRSNYCGYLHVLRYSLLIIIILKQKGIAETNRFADI